MSRPNSPDDRNSPTRRAFLAGLAAAGAGAAAVGAATPDTGPRALEDVRAAARLADLEMTDAEIELMLEDLNELRDKYRQLRTVQIGNEVPPAVAFQPLAPAQEPATRDLTSKAAELTALPADAPNSEVDQAFASIRQQGAWLRSGEITSESLTRLYLERLKRLAPKLEFLISLTAERALEEAARADRELAKGIDRGPLHGLPWGAKDLLAATGYDTTWGAQPYRQQRLEEDATVVRKLSQAGAVLVAKLSLGALAWGDVWFDGTTRNPWNPEQGSSGSSAGSASATAAGAVSFSLGSETLGSIVSPCTRCGVTGLRPTFGRVSRRGAMALSWSMDKLGPITRSVEDCALVFEAIQGVDLQDPSTAARDFHWQSALDPSRLRVGVVRSAFEEERSDESWRDHDLRSLETLEKLGLNLVDIELPTQGDDALPVAAASFVLSAEAAAAFDELTRSHRDDELVRQIRRAWPNVFRQARTIPAVEYIQANRLRTLVMQRMQELMETIDVYVCPSYGASNLLMTNLTGHPAVVLPNGFRADGTPTSLSFTGRLFGENALLAVARAYQDATRFHLERPPMAL